MILRLGYLAVRSPPSPAQLLRLRANPLYVILEIEVYE